VPTKKKKTKPNIPTTPEGRRVLNEKMIRDLMKIKKYRGNPRDYFAITGETVLDVYGVYKVKRIDDTGSDELLLMHKRNMHRFIDPEEAAMFWNRTHGVRVPRRIVNGVAEFPKSKKKVQHGS
jgi:hypothetical protein